MNSVLITVGVVLLGAGVLWTLQGVGVVGGSAMTGVALWAIIGPIVAVVGLVLLGWGIVRVRGKARG